QSLHRFHAHASQFEPFRVRDLRNCLRLPCADSRRHSREDHPHETGAAQRDLAEHGAFTGLMAGMQVGVLLLDFTVQRSCGTGAVTLSPKNENVSVLSTVALVLAKYHGPQPE